MVNSRNKGASAERELAAKLRDMGFENARRGQQFKGGTDSPDIADAIPNVHIECKRVERLNLSDAQAQACRDAGGKVPTVFHRRNRGQWWVTVPLDRLEELAESVLHGNGQIMKFGEVMEQLKKYPELAKYVDEFEQLKVEGK